MGITGSYRGGNGVSQSAARVLVLMEGIEDRAEGGGQRSEIVMRNGRWEKSDVTELLALHWEPRVVW